MLHLNGRAVPLAPVGSGRSAARTGRMAALSITAASVLAVALTNAPSADAAASTLTQTATITLASPATAMSVDPVANQLYLLENGAGNVVSVDGTTNAVRDFPPPPAGLTTVALAADSVTHTVYSVSAADARGPNPIIVADGVTGNVVATLSLPGVPVRNGIVVDAATNTIYIQSNKSASAGSPAAGVLKIDGATNTITATLPLPLPSFTPAGPLTASLAGTTFSVTDVATGATVATVTDPASNGTFVFNQKTQKLYAANTDGTIAVYTLTVPVPSFSYNIHGSTFIKAANGTAPLSGVVAGQPKADGTFTGTLKLNATKGVFTIFGFFPATADLSFTQTSPITGTVHSGVLSATANMTVTVSSFTLLGYTLGGGAQCHTAAPVTVAVKSAAGSTSGSAPGLNVTGTYTLPPVTGCGPLTGLLSTFEAGPGNTFTATLTG